MKYREEEIAEFRKNNLLISQDALRHLKLEEDLTKNIEKRKRLYDLAMLNRR